MRPLEAIVRAVDPRLDVEVTGSDTDWVATLVPRDGAGAGGRRGRGHPVQHRHAFAFEPRRSIPITPV